MTLKTQPEEDLTEFTRRAMRATVDITPPTVFVPLALRHNKRRIVGKAIIKRSMTRQEIEDAIAAADPVSFLIAVMQGQPIPRFTITEEKDRLNVKVGYDIPSTELRTEVALALSRVQRGMAAKKPGEDGYDAMIAGAANGLQ